MAASAETRYYHGSSPGTAGANVIGITVRHKRADNDALDSNNPVPLPVSGQNFGWRKFSKMNWVSTPAGSITNLRWFITTTPPTGIRYYARVNAVYTQGGATDEDGIPGFDNDAGEQAANDATQYTSSAPLSVNAGTVLSNPSTGEGTQSFVETHLGVQSTYAGGPGPFTPAIGVTYRYAET